MNWNTNRLSFVSIKGLHMGSGCTHKKGQTVERIPEECNWYLYIQYITEFDGQAVGRDYIEEYFISRHPTKEEHVADLRAKLKKEMIIYRDSDIYDAGFATKEDWNFDARDGKRYSYRFADHIKLVAKVGKEEIRVLRQLKVIE